MSSSVNADLFKFDKSKVEFSGELTVGGYYDIKNNEIHNKEVTGATFISNYRDGLLIGNAEIDVTLEDNYGTAVNSNVDKLYVGLSTQYGTITIGTDNDTAIDYIDHVGDLTVEFGHRANNTTDAHNVIKFDVFAPLLGGTFVSGGSIAERDPEECKDVCDDGEVISGYHGLEIDYAKIYFGFEYSESEDVIYMLTTRSKLYNFDIASLLFSQDNDVRNIDEYGGYSSFGTTVYPKTYLSFGYGFTESNIDDRIKKINKH